MRARKESLLPIAEDLPRPSLRFREVQRMAREWAICAEAVEFPKELFPLDGLLGISRRELPVERCAADC